MTSRNEPALTSGQVPETDCGWRRLGIAAAVVSVLIALADDYWRSNPVFHDHWIY